MGSDTVQTLKFKNYLKKAVPYQVKIERLGAPKPAAGGKETKNQLIEFTILEKDPVTAPPSDSKEGVDVPVNIRFEPSSMNESKAILTISNPEGGTYQYYLVGQTTAPQPKGPYKNSGKGIAIDFKNPFYEATEFMVRIDNPSFTTSVKNPWKLEVNPANQAGKPATIPVTYKAVPGYGATGRVTVSAEGVPQWTFYVEENK